MDVEYLVMNSGTLGVQTLLSNDSQFLSQRRAGGHRQFAGRGYRDDYRRL
jgi:hypothetical protein